jgi:endo-1,4-beta-xylanase
LRSVAERIGIGSLGFECMGRPGYEPHTQLLANNFNYLTNPGVDWSLTQATRNGATPPSWRDECIGPPPQSGGYDFRIADRFRDFAVSHGMRIMAGTLVYHATTPSWVTPLSPTETRQVLTEHLNTVVSRYRGQFALWHVVNEALAPDATPANGGYPSCSSPEAATTSRRGCTVSLPNGVIALRNTAWARKFGVGFIVDAFRIVRQADPGATLSYMDYAIEGATEKFQWLLTLLGYLRSQGVRVDAVGFQTHLRVSGDEWTAPPAAHIAQNIQTLAALGYKVNITELDVSATNYPADADAQRSIYHDVVQVCMENAACQLVALYGVGDRDSWLQPANHCDNHTAPAPLLWDCNYARKPAYQGVLDALLHH